MIFVLNEQLKPAKHRVPDAEHFNLYRKASRDAPGLVEKMYAQIKEMVTADQYLDPDGRFPNSTWLGSQLLNTWEHTDEWNEFTGGDEGLSSSLFGQIMWTVMFDDERRWCTTKTSNANVDREQRVYWLLKDAQSKRT